MEWEKPSCRLSWGGCQGIPPLNVEQNSVLCTICCLAWYADTICMLITLWAIYQGIFIRGFITIAWTSIRCAERFGFSHLWQTLWRLKWTILDKGIDQKLARDKALKQGSLKVVYYFVALVTRLQQKDFAVLQGQWDSWERWRINGQLRYWCPTKASQTEIQVPKMGSVHLLFVGLILESK